MITVSHAVFSSAVADDNSLSIRLCSIVGEIQYTTLGNGKFSVTCPITNQKILIIALNHRITGKSHIPPEINRISKNRFISGKNNFHIRPVKSRRCTVQRTECIGSETEFNSIRCSDELPVCCSSPCGIHI